MDDSYILGVCAAIVAGITFNLGMVFQKVVVNRTDRNASLMRQILRSPLWLAGFALQFFIGVPLNMLAQSNIGPALIPGLYSAGMIVLALGAVWLAKERVGWQDMIGILLVIAATALCGLSRLGIDMEHTNLLEPDLSMRLGIFTALVAAGSLVCHLWQLRNIRQRGNLRAVNSGLYYVQSALWLGVLMGLFGRWGQGEFSTALLVGVAVACVLTAAGSLLGIIETQRAFQCGDATRIVPIQTAPQQILVPASYFLVFQLTPPNTSAVPLVGAAVVMILAGSILLARRQVLLSAAPSEKPFDLTGESV